MLGAGERPEGVDWIYASLTEDPRGQEVEHLVATAKSWPAAWVLLDHPRSLRAGRLQEMLREAGYAVGAIEVRCVDFGDATARTRGVLIAAPGLGGWDLGAEAAKLCEGAPAGRLRDHGGGDRPERVVTTLG